MAVGWLLGHPPTREEILYMTAGAEYADRAFREGQTIIPEHPAYSIQEAGRIGLARNYYSASEGRLKAGTTDLYEFMTGYQPWLHERYADDLYSELHDNLPGVDEAICSDVDKILRPASIGWTTGKSMDEPWQWYGPVSYNIGGLTFGTSRTDFAILAVDLGNGEYFFMFTGAQNDNSPFHSQ